MAVGEAIWPEMYPIQGLQIGVAQAGVKYEGRNDVVVFSVCEGAHVAGVFTQNAFAAAPVIVAKRHLLASNTRALIVNSGNANACTGDEGMAGAELSCMALAKELKVNPESVLPFSTGVIGEPLPVNKIIDVLPAAITSLQEDNWLAAARTIMTTDTRPKGASKQFDVGGETVHVVGISKGAGMIRPNMATMLAYVATDANIDPVLLQNMTKIAADKSFNRITIDGDTSTNDACMLIATGKSSAPRITSTQDEGYQLLLNAAIEVFHTLAKQIVCDGEGATKCVCVEVGGGDNAQECLDAAYAIAHSPLVKTAWFASDANWGRIVAAIGYAGIAELNASNVNVWLNEVKIVENGCRSASYTEAQGQSILSLAEFTVRVDLGRGECSESIWTSDLSHEYVRINADYRS